MPGTTLEADLPGPDAFRAQFGEDRLLADHFRDRKDGFYVEVGAFNGVDMSNTFYFEQLGWTGILVEADPALAEECRRHRPRSVVVNCAATVPGSGPTATFRILDGAEALSSLSQSPAAGADPRVRQITVPAGPLDRLLEERQVERIDFITIDVEGHEWGVLQGFNLERWRPGVVILEHNHRLPDRRILAYLSRSDYCYRFSTGVNDWYFAGRSGAARSLAYRGWLFYTLYLFRPISPLYYRLKHAAKLGLIRLRLLRYEA